MVLPIGLVFFMIFFVSGLIANDNNSSCAWVEKKKETLKNPSYMDSQNNGFTLFVPRAVVHLYSPFESHAFPSL